MHATCSAIRQYFFERLGDNARGIDINLGVYIRTSGHGMNPKIHKLFLTRCDLEESRRVSAVDCEPCPQGSVIDGRSQVICAGQTKFFVTPCYYGMRASASVRDCEKCRFGEVGTDGLRVLCGRG